jgi:hypothetical protein
METFFKYASDIISQAAQSPFGILALIILVIAFLAFFFFQKAKEATRIFIFLLILAAGIAFGAVVVNQSREDLINRSGAAAINALTAINRAPAIDDATNTVTKSTTTTTQTTNTLAEGDWTDSKWQDARNCISWVFADNGARNTYLAGRNRGLTQFEAVLAAEGHDPGAQRLIMQFGADRMKQFIKSMGQ